jgi:hypothetical protein
VILLEFAAQGVRGVAPAGGRATLRPGYNVVSADGPTLRRLLEALFYPSPRDAEGPLRAGAHPGAAPVRAGLTLAGDDRVTYRLVRDFAGTCQLHRFDAEKRSFALVSQDLAEIGTFLRETGGVPGASRFASLLSLVASELPSRQGGVPTGLASAEAAHRTTLPPEQAKKRLPPLRAELERARAAEKLQYQLDGLQTRLFKLEEALKGGTRVREGLEKAETARAEMEETAQAAAGMGDAESKLAGYERLAARREEAIAKAGRERANLDDAEATGAPLPFWQDLRFWAATGGGLLLAAAAALGAASRMEIHYLSLPAIAAYGAGAWFALRWVGAVEAWDRVARRRRVLDDWERKLNEQFERDGAEVHAAMKALGLTRASELKEAVIRLSDADKVVAEWRRRLAEWEASPETQEALREKAGVAEQVLAAEARLAAEAGGFVRDVRSVEAEIQRVEADAAAPPGQASAPAVATPPRSAADPLRTVLERAAAELGGSPAAVARAVAAKASQHLSGLSFQRLSAIQPDDRGNLAVATGGRPAPVGTLSALDRDLVWLALKLALVERALAEAKTVALVDDAFAGLPDGARRFAARLLKQLSRPGQIVHATADPAFREAADHVA